MPRMQNAKVKCAWKELGKSLDSRKEQRLKHTSTRTSIKHALLADPEHEFGLFKLRPTVSYIDIKLERELTRRVALAKG